MARITRRRVLKLSGAGVVAAQTGGLAAILATGRAPAYAQGTNIHWLRWADFVPASDVLLKGQITQECQKATGITLKVETINANDLQSRITSAIQSGSGADIIMAIGNWPQLYAESVVDASDVAEEIAKAQGGYHDVSKPGTRCSMPARNSRPRAAPSVKLLDTPSAMRRAGGTRICGLGAGRRSRPTARRWS